MKWKENIRHHSLQQGLAAIKELVGNGFEPLTDIKAHGIALCPNGVRVRELVYVVFPTNANEELGCIARQKSIISVFERRFLSDDKPLGENSCVNRSFLSLV